MMETKPPHDKKTEDDEREADFYEGPANPPPQGQPDGDKPPDSHEPPREQPPPYKQPPPGPMPPQESIPPGAQPPPYKQPPQGTMPPRQGIPPGAQPPPYGQPPQGTMPPQQGIPPGAQSPYGGPPPYGMPGPMPYGPGMPMAPSAYPVGAGEAISGAIELYTKNFRDYFLFWGIPTVFLFVIGFLSYFLGINNSMEFDFAVFTMAIFMGILSAVVTVLFSGGIIAMTKEVMCTGNTSVSTGLQIIKKRGGTIVVTSIVVSILVMVGSFLCVIPGLIFCYWYFFAITIVVVEGYSVGDAMKRSKDFARLSDPLGFIIILMVLIILISLLASIFEFMFAFVVGNEILSILLAQTVSWIISPFMFIATAYYYVKSRRLDSPSDSQDDDVAQYPQQQPPSYP